MSRSERKSTVSVQSNKKTIQIRDDTVKSSRSSHKVSREYFFNDLRNPENIHQTNNKKVNMQMIFQVNKQYLLDKIAISQVPKPSKYYHKLPSKTPNTTYNNQFHKINQNLMNNLKLERKDNLFNQKNVVSNYQSLYGQNFSHKKQNISPQKNKGESQKQNAYRPIQGPTFLQTSYKCDFSGNYNPIPAQSAKMKEIKLMGGGKFQGETTYHGVYKSHDKKKQMPIHQSNNKIFMSIDAPKQTTYEKQFNSIKNEKYKKSKTIESSPQFQEKKRASSQMFSTENMDKKSYKSQYERSFQTIQPKKSSREKKVNIMSLQEMKNLILNVI